MSDLVNEIELAAAGGEGSGEEEKKPQVRFTPFTEANRDLEVVVSDEPLEEELAEEPSLEEVKAKLAKTEAELQVAKQGGSTADAVRQLAEHLKPQQQQQQVPLFLEEAQRASEINEEEAKKLAELAYEGEGGTGFTSALDKYNAKKLLPGKAKAVMDKLYWGQKWIEGDASKKEFHTKYRTEIQNVINQTPLDRLYNLQDPYLEAYNHVLSQHQEEVMQTAIQDQIAAGVAAELERRGYKPAEKPASGTQTFTEGGQRPAPQQQGTGGQKKRVRLNTREEADRLRKNMTPGAYNAFLARNPKYRRALNERS